MKTPKEKKKKKTQTQTTNHKPQNTKQEKKEKKVGVFFGGSLQHLSELILAQLRRQRRCCFIVAATGDGVIIGGGVGLVAKVDLGRAACLVVSRLQVLEPVVLLLLLLFSPHDEKQGVWLGGWSVVVHNRTSPRVRSGCVCWVVCVGLCVLGLG